MTGPAIWGSDSFRSNAEKKESEVAKNRSTGFLGRKGEKGGIEGKNTTVREIDEK